MLPVKMNTPATLAILDVTCSQIWRSTNTLTVSNSFHVTSATTILHQIKKWEGTRRGNILRKQFLATNVNLQLIISICWKRTKWANMKILRSAATNVISLSAARVVWEDMAWEFTLAWCSLATSASNSSRREIGFKTTWGQPMRGQPLLVKCPTVIMSQRWRLTCRNTWRRHIFEQIHKKDALNLFSPKFAGNKFLVLWPSMAVA